jgi:hypothetical protein
MPSPTSPKPKYLRWLSEFLFTSYVAFLVVALGSQSPSHWPVRLQIFIASHGFPNARVLTDEGFSYYSMLFFLVWGGAITLFLCLRFASRFALGRTTLGIIVPVITIVGFPVASLYAGNGRMPFLEIELLIVGVCVALWARGRWLVSLTTGIFILTLHFALWAWFSRFFPYLCCLYLWPGWIWRSSAAFADKMRVVYPVLGWCAIVSWATQFRIFSGLGAAGPADVRRSQSS